MSATEVFVLGHRGMLGHTVVHWLREIGFSVRTTETRYRGSEEDDLIQEIAATACPAVVNCIGTTTRRASDISELFSINALLPQRLAAALGPGRLLVQASSDGVFDGRRGTYSVDEIPNASDAYGLSKRLGELAVHLGRVVLLRCSVIGIDDGDPRGLLSWFLCQTEPVTGYTDHHWNGITALEWAKIAARALRGDPVVGPGVHQPACAVAVTKYELLALAARVFHHDVSLHGRPSDNLVDRTLLPTIVCPPIFQQLEELRVHLGFAT